MASDSDRRSRRSSSRSGGSSPGAPSSKPQTSRTRPCIERPTGTSRSSGRLCRRARLVPALAPRARLEPPARSGSWGKLNASVNCVDRHATGPRRNKAALIWEGEPGDQRTITYRELLREVGKFSNVLKALGVAKGDRVTLYMPMIPELPIAMLACARLGAIHSVVFGGFSAESLRDRITTRERNLVTARRGLRRGTSCP